MVRQRRECEVADRRQAREAVRGDIEFVPRDAADHPVREFGSRESRQSPREGRAEPGGPNGALEDLGPGPVDLEGLDEQVVGVEHVDAALRERVCEGVVLLARPAHPELVVEQELVLVARREPAELRAGPVEDDLPTDPAGLGAEQSWLDGSPFPDYTGPGLVLLVVVGGGMLVAAAAALLARESAAGAAATMGVVLLAWGVVETVTVGWRGTPQIVLLALFVVAPAAVLIAVGRASLRPVTPSPEARGSTIAG